MVDRPATKTQVKSVVCEYLYSCVCVCVCVSVCVCVCVCVRTYLDDWSRHLRSLFCFMSSQKKCICLTYPVNCSSLQT
jgi:hypothetical protein